MDNVEDESDKELNEVGAELDKMIQLVEMLADKVERLAKEIDEIKNDNRAALKSAKNNYQDDE